MNILHLSSLEQGTAKKTMQPVKSMSDLSVASEEVTVATANESETASVSEFSTDSRKVSFGPIHMREYERIVGDHPDTKVGVPLSIGWGYHEKNPVSIERFEADRLPKERLRMSSITRKNILHNVFGISEEELRAAEKEVQKIRKLREQTSKGVKKNGKPDTKFKLFKQTIRRALTADSLMRGITAAVSAGMVLPISHQ
jgi:hypothetical protein